MRLAPVAVRFSCFVKKNLEAAVLQSHATHPGVMAALCAHFLAFLVGSAIERDDSAPGDMRRWLDAKVVE